MTYDDGLTPLQRAFLESRYNAEAFSDMSAQDINRMDMATFARLTNRATPTQAAVSYLDAQHERTQPPAPAAPQTAVDTPQGLDPDSAEFFHAWRAQRGLDRTDAGMFGSISSRSEEYTSAVRAQSGRHALSNANVVQPPRLEGRTILKQDDRLDPRSAAQRFGSPSNAFNL